MGIHWDGTVSLGSLLTLLLVGIAVAKLWSSQNAAKEAQAEFKKDLQWRISNLEVWRKEHMIDSDARDVLLKKLDSVSQLLDYLVKERRRDNEGRRSPREGQY
jgi:hypothetical protein